MEESRRASAAPLSAPGAPAIHDVDQGAIVPHRAPPPAAYQQEEDETNFDEPDPIIMIPVLVDHSHGAGSIMLPPPPRTAEETERHQERLEMRRAGSARRDRRNGRQGGGAVPVRDREAGRDVARVPPLGKGERKASSDNKARDANWDRRYPPQDKKENSLSFSRSILTKQRTHRNNDRDDTAVATRNDDRDKAALVPSLAALALLEGGNCNADALDPPQDNRRERKQQREKKRQVGGKVTNPPPMAPALLEGGNLKSSERRSRVAQQTRTRKKDRLRPRGGRMGDVDDTSETSSISSASAKRYDRNTSDFARRHPELEGVRLPDPPPFRIPADVMLDRSGHGRKDPPTAPAGIRRTASHRASSSRASRAMKSRDRGVGTRVLVEGAPAGRGATKEKGPERESRDRGVGSRALVAVAPGRGAAKERRRRHEGRALLEKETKNKPPSKRVPPRRDASRSRRKGDEFNGSATATAASSARPARRGSGAGIRMWDVGGNEVAGVGDDARNRRRTSRSKERSTPRTQAAPSSSSTRSGSGKNRRSQSASSRRAASKGASRSKEQSTPRMQVTPSSSPARSRSGKKRRIQSVSSRRAGSKSVDRRRHRDDKGGRSLRTQSTRAESSSSGEALACQKSSEEKDAATDGEADGEGEVAEPVMIYKRRARRGGAHGTATNDYAATTYTKPMTLIACSSDEKSHASSISVTSTIEESFTYSDEEDEDKDGRKNVKKKALSALQRGKSVLKLEGLKGAGRKWQSALFV